MNNLLLFKVTKNKNYTTLNLSCVNDNLSWKAKGLHTYLISRPETWKIWKDDLIKRSKDGVSSLESGLKELVDNKYLYRLPQRNSNGTFAGCIYLVFEEPTYLSKKQIMKEIQQLNPQLGFPCTDKPDTDKPDTDNLTHSNNNNSNKDSNNNDSSKSDSKESEQEILAIFNKWNDIAKRLTDATVHRSIYSKCATNKQERNNPSEIKTIIQKSLKKCNLPQIIASLENYYSVIKSDDYYYDYIFPNIGIFLGSDKGLIQFLSENKPFQKFSKGYAKVDEFEQLRNTFKPVTEDWEVHDILNETEQTYYGFSINSIKGYKGRMEDLNRFLISKNNWDYSKFWLLELIIASLLWYRKTDPQLDLLKKYIKLWIRLKPKFEKEK